MVTHTNRTLPFMIFSVTCVIMSLTLFSGVCYITFMINNFTISATLMTLGVRVRVLIFWHEICSIVL